MSTCDRQLIEKCITIHADVTQEDHVERAIKEAVDAFGRIDYAAYWPISRGCGSRD